MFRDNKLRKDENGQSIVEFALILPILILIIMGIIEFGWLFNAKITLTSAAREGARAAAVFNSELAKDAVMNTSGLSGLSIIEDDIEFKYIDSEGNIEDSLSDIPTTETNIIVRVVVPATVDPLVRFFIKDTVNMNTEAHMRIESLVSD